MATSTKFSIQFSFTIQTIPTKLGQPRDAGSFIKQWQHLVEDRPQHATEPLTKDQVGSIFHRYIENFITYEATDAQRNEKRSKLKSKAEAKLKDDSGSVMLAKLIWKVGLPDISKHRDSIKTDTEKILKWLSMSANEITVHKATPEYQEHARKSGTEKNRSGLNEMERSTREEMRWRSGRRYGRHPPHPKILKLGRRGRREESGGVQYTPTPIPKNRAARIKFRNLP